MDRPIAIGARSVDLPIEPEFQLGRARVHPEAHEYVIGGTSTRMQPQTLKVLVALHDKCGHVVSRDELVDRCWGGRIVGDDVINRCISQLRLFATESGGFQIETISRAGYRLIEESATATPKWSRSPWMVAGAAAAVVVALGAIGFAERGHPGEARARVEVEPLKAPASDAAALALGQGFGASIERDLAGSETPVEIVDPSSQGRASVRLRGTSISDHGELRASLQLVSGGSGEVIWASNFERPLGQFDQLQDQLSLQVARELHCAYSDGRKPYFDADVEFAKLSLAHCDTLGRDADESVRLDAQIVQRAPAFARGWAEYAIDTAFQSYELPPLLHSAGESRAIALARHALALDPHQGLAYTAIGVATEDTASWLDNERLVRRALIADPKSAEAHNWQSGQLAEIGRLQEGLNEAKISYQFDHFLPGKIDQLIRFNIALGNLDDAQDDLALARRNWPGNPWWDSDAILLGVAGRAPDQALKLLTAHQVRTSAPRERALIAFLGWRIAPARATRLAAVNSVEAASREDGPTDEQVQLLAVLGKFDEAYRLAARPPSSTGAGLGWFGPYLGEFRGDARFMPLAARQGLAQIWLEIGLWPDFCRTQRKLDACRAAAAAAVRARPLKA